MTRVLERVKPLVYGEDEIYTKITLCRGEVIDFAVIYYTLTEGEPHQVVRYDCAHGHAHKDTLCTNPPKKEDMPRLPYKELFNRALDDIEKNWRRYKQQHKRIKKEGKP
ncbi:MAG: hypothetical protein V1875_10305 [Candidatus Altiarchaeota archaeon]